MHPLGERGPVVLEAPHKDGGGAVVAGVTKARGKLAVAANTKEAPPDLLVADWNLGDPPLYDPFLSYIASRCPVDAKDLKVFLDGLPLQDTETNRKALSAFCVQLGIKLPQTKIMRAAIMQSVFSDERRLVHLDALQKIMAESDELIVPSSAHYRDALLQKATDLALATILPIIDAHRGKGAKKMNQYRILLRSANPHLAASLSEYGVLTVVAGSKSAAAQMYEKKTDIGAAWIVQESRLPVSGSQQQDLVVIDGLPIGDLHSSDFPALLECADGKLCTDGRFILLQQNLMKRSILDIAEETKRLRESDPRMNSPECVDLFIGLNLQNVKAHHPKLQFSVKHPAAIVSLAALIESHLPDTQRGGDLDTLIKHVEKADKHTYPLLVLTAEKGRSTGGSVWSLGVEQKLPPSRPLAGGPVSQVADLIGPRATGSEVTALDEEGVEDDVDDDEEDRVGGPEEDGDFVTLVDEADRRSRKKSNRKSPSKPEPAPKVLGTPEKKSRAKSPQAMIAELSEQVREIMGSKTEPSEKQQKQTVLLLRLLDQEGEDLLIGFLTKSLTEERIRIWRKIHEALTTEELVAEVFPGGVASSAVKSQAKDKSAAVKAPVARAADGGVDLTDPDLETELIVILDKWRAPEYRSNTDQCKAALVLLAIIWGGDAAAKTRVCEKYDFAEDRFALAWDTWSVKPHRDLLPALLLTQFGGGGER